MIRSLREHLTDRGFRIILLIALLGSFVLASVVPVFYSLFSKNSEDGVHATINDIDITTTEFARKVQAEQNRRDMFRQQFGKEANNFLAMLGMSGSVEDFVFEKLRYEKIIDSLARDINLEIAPSYIVAQLQDKNFLENELGLSSFVDPLGRVDLDSLGAVLRQQGLSIADLEKDAENSLRRSFVQKFIQAAAYTPDYMVRQNYIQENVARKYTIITFARDYFLNEVRKQEVTDEKLTKFFDRENSKNKRYLIPEKRSGYFFRLDPLSYGIDVTDKEIETKYNRTKKNYLVTNEMITVRQQTFPFDSTNKDEIRAQADASLIAIKENPKNIAKAKTESIERGKSEDKKLSRAAFGLKEDGDISEVVETAKEFVILQRVNKSAVQYKSLAEVSDDIKDILLMDKFKSRFPQEVRRAINEAKIVSFLEEKRASKNIINNQANTDDKIISKLFTLGLDKYGYIFDRGQGHVVQVTDIQKAHLPLLSEVKDIVLADYYQAEADKALNQAVQSAYEELAASSISNETTSTTSFPGASELVTDFIKPNDQDEINKLENKGIPVPAVFALATAKSLFKEVSGKNGVIIRLDALAEIDEKDYEKEKFALRASLLKQAERAFHNSFVADLLKNAKINMYAPSTARRQR